MSIRRIERELTITGDKYPILQLENVNNEDIWFTTMILQYVVTVYLHRFFPFKPPKVIINNKPYLSIFRGSYSRYQKYYNRYGIHMRICPCCYTILCNWSPANKIIHILKEIENWEMDRRRIESIYAYSIVQHKLPFDRLITASIISFI